MDINKQINKLKESIFEDSFKKNITRFKEELNNTVNSLITEYEFEAGRVLTIEQIKKAKVLILQKKILPIIADPMQKSVIFALIGEFEEGNKIV